MRKALYLVLLLAMSGITAFAEENITVERLTIPQGKQAEMVVNFNFNEPHEYVSYQFTVELPEGVSLVADAYGKAGYSLPDNQPSALFSVDFLASNGIVKVWSSPSTPIGGSTGVLICIPVQASADLAVGTELSGRLKDVEFTKNTGAVRTPFADVTIPITIDEPLLVFDEDATRLPQYTAGEKDNVRMKRTIKANQWSTIVLPFTLTKAKAEAAFGSDVQLAEFTGFEAVYADEAIRIDVTNYTMTAKKGMTGGKPYLIRTSQDIESFQADQVTLTDAVNDVTQTDEYDISGRFTGTLVPTVVPEDGLFLNGGKFWYSTGKSTAKAFRCWFELGVVLGKETDFGARAFLNFVDTETTGIGDVKRLDGQGKMRNDSPVYNLQGQRVVKPAKGLFIQGGRKIVKK